MGLLLRTFWPAADALRQVAAQLRPDWARLLSGELSGVGSCAADPGASAVFVHGDRIRAVNFSARDSAEETGKATESVSVGSVAVSPDDQSVDAGCSVARNQPQPAERLGPSPGYTE